MSLSDHSLALLAHVNAPLPDIAQRAYEIGPIKFSVVQGNRTPDDQARLFGKGRTPEELAAYRVPGEHAQPHEKKVTWTLHSNHIGGNAIDVCPLVDGQMEWDNDGKLGLWPKLAAQFKQAAQELGHTIFWGGDWLGGKDDRPHFSLVEG